MWVRWPKRRWRCLTHNGQVDVADRQKRVPGWDQDRVARAVVLSVGAGGLGGEVVAGCVMKGYGRIHVCDMDSVATTNLNRQPFAPKHVGRLKARALCEIQSKRGFQGTELVAHPVPVQDLDLGRIGPDVVHCGVDMQLPDTRRWLCEQLIALGIPGVFSAVSRDASSGYVFVQLPDEACWTCALKPEFARFEDEQDGARCPGTPAVVDILKAIGGLALHAIDSILMPGRGRDWNYRRVSLTHGALDTSLCVEPRITCPVCGSG